MTHSDFATDATYVRRYVMRKKRENHHFGSRKIRTLLNWPLKDGVLTHGTQKIGSVWQIRPTVN